MTAITGPPASDHPLSSRLDRRLPWIAWFVALGWRSGGRKPAREHEHLGYTRVRPPCTPPATVREWHIALQGLDFEPSRGSPRNSAGVQISNRGSPSSSSKSYTRGRTWAL